LASVWVADPTTFMSSFFGAAEQIFLSPLGVIGGVQVGYNWQAARQVVLGAEADFQGSSQRDSANCLGGCASFANFVAEGETIVQKINWFGTVRGRVGWTDGPTLYYATGGFAYGDATTVYPSADQPVSAGGMQTGWTAGGGIETRLLGNWTGKIEYLYVDLGSESASISAFPARPLPLPVSISSNIQDHVVRVGLNYQFH
jgi:outer membrane immunogenic protein